MVPLRQQDAEEVDGNKRHVKVQSREETPSQEEHEYVQ